MTLAVEQCAILTSRVSPSVRSRASLLSSNFYPSSLKALLHVLPRSFLYQSGQLHEMHWLEKIQPYPRLEWSFPTISTASDMSVSRWKPQCQDPVSNPSSSQPLGLQDDTRDLHHSLAYEYSNFQGGEIQEFSRGEMRDYNSACKYQGIPTTFTSQHKHRPTIPPSSTIQLATTQLHIQPQP